MKLDVKELIAKTLTHLTTKTSAIIPASGFSYAVNNIYKSGNVVTLSFFITNANSGGEQRVGTIPEGFRPISALRGPLGYTTQAAAGASEYFIVDQAGALFVNNRGNYVLCTITYVCQ